MKDKEQTGRRICGSEGTFRKEGPFFGPEAGARKECKTAAVSHALRENVRVVPHGAAQRTGALFPTRGTLSV